MALIKLNINILLRFQSCPCSKLVNIIAPIDDSVGEEEC